MYRTLCSVFLPSLQVVCRVHNEGISRDLSPPFSEINYIFKFFLNLFANLIVPRNLKMKVIKRFIGL
jgi:hypothetical protein